MIIYNVTVKIEKNIHDEWLNWMKETHIPEVLETGYFIENNMYKVLVEEDDGITYSIQYSCNNQETLNTYFDKHALTLQAKFKDRYEGKYVVFRTLLEKI